MPVYEYACDDCHQTTEAIRRMDDADSPIACEHCDSTATSRVQSTFLAEASRPASTSTPWAGSAGGGCGCGKPHGSCSP